MSEALIPAQGPVDVNVRRNRCDYCGCIFTDGPEYTICEVCLTAIKEAMRQDEQREEWHAEMRRDAFGD